MILKDLGKVIDNSKERLLRLKVKYPELDAYLVFSSNMGQVNLTNDGLTILREFSKMFVPSTAKNRSVELIKQLKDLEKVGRELDETRKVQALKEKSEKENELSKILPSLELEPNSQVELRFGNLNHELIAKLQKDTLVDQNLTMQSRASIRIVLGTIKSLS